MSETFEHWKEASRPPFPPADLRGGIGPGDFWRDGYVTAKAVSEACDVPGAGRVVELGSGLGRVALPLCSLLPIDARYCGYDVAKPYVAWCEQALRLPIQGSFVHLDLANSQYNPGGAQAAHRARIPEGTGTVDLVFATSLLTHLVPREIKRYLAEVARMLRSGGTFFCTVFLVDEKSTPLIRAQQTYPKFAKRVRNAYLANGRSPGEGVAVDRAWFFGRARKSGLVEVETVLGSWRGIAGVHYQDVVVLRKG